MLCQNLIVVVNYGHVTTLERLDFINYKDYEAFL